MSEEFNKESSQLSAEQLKTIGNEYFKQGHMASAWAYYDAAAKKDRSTPVYFANRAQCELKMEQFGGAVESCGEALEIDPRHVKSYYRRAIAFVGVLEYALAVKDFQRVVELAPSFEEGKRKLRDAQALARYTAFQRAIKSDDEPDVLTTINLETMPESDGPESQVEGLENLDNLTETSFKNVVEHFKNGKRLPRRMVYDIVIRVAKLFQEEPTMNEISNDLSELITVCGDTHGQFYDVLNILDTNGWPSEKHTYVFNGDFVDRGSWSTEVALLLYLLKIRYPRNIYINRGNHETDAMNAVYGFSGECKAKYGSEKVFKAFSESFSRLPLACLINDDYFVVHGGLYSKDVTLDQIRKIDRFATKQPGSTGLVMEMLWSDPMETEGLAPSKRGIAHMFGPDVTERFVRNNKLKAVLRSHECCDNGIEKTHDGNLYTVFSAPNYCDSVGNKGGYFNIRAGQELEGIQFEASPHPKIPPMAYASGVMR